MRLVRSRLVSLALVLSLGFLLLVSLAVSAGLSALAALIDGRVPFDATLLQMTSIAVSFILIAIVFAAIYKLLPDTDILWRDVVVGAVVTSLLFEAGKFLIGLYIGRTATASAYGAAGALLVVLLWTYYSVQIFLLGAEFTKVFARRRAAPATDPSLPR